MTNQTDLKELLTKSQEESKKLSKQINILTAQKAEIDNFIASFSKTLGVKIPRKERLFESVRFDLRAEFQDVTLLESVIETLKASGGGMSRKDIAKSITIANSPRTELVVKAIWKLEQLPESKEIFEYLSKPISVNAPKRTVQVICLKKEAPKLQVVGSTPKLDVEHKQAIASPSPMPVPQSFSSESQIDIFADLNDFSERTVAKHYPKKAAKS